MSNSKLNNTSSSVKADSTGELEGRLARDLIFYDLPAWIFTILHIAFGLVVILAFLLVPPRFSKTK